ncbi:type IV pilin [Methanosarcina sp. DH1]|uniref:type IV pilin N-terminal domain-containing protein n=1 Tax=Methanosarcina sp. DH1 TaxID=2605695 RepID=UPI001E4EA78A|nr:type IV pilin [Methanosarcina sp. DH1]
MEGKKRWAFCQDCRGVSEVYGQLLMIGIVVIAFSTIAVTVFSDENTVKPEHIPHTDLQENFNRSAKTIQIVHSGGEAIDESDIKIMVSVDGENKGEFDSDDFNVKNPDGTYSSDGVFTLGDCIEIDTSSMDLKAGDDIDIFFVDTPSEQVIQKAVLQRYSGEIPTWITPHPYGSVYSNSTDGGGWQPTELVDAINDSIYTKTPVLKDQYVYQEFQFGIDADEMGISNPLNLVQLKIIYSSHDCSPDGFPLSVYNGSDWVQINYIMKENYDFTQCEADGLTVFDISSAPYYVNTTEKLEKLVVRFSATGNAASDKYYCVDFVGIHVEF